MVQEGGIKRMNGSELRRILSKVGITQRELARRLGLNPVSVCRWEDVPEYASAYVVILDKLDDLVKGG